MLTLLYAFTRFLYPFLLLLCFYMLKNVLYKFVGRRMMLALCITGFCFAESGKNLWNGTLNAMKSRAHAKLF